MSDTRLTGLRLTPTQGDLRLGDTGLKPKATSPFGLTLGVLPQTQSGNGCGTTSLAMALSYSTGAPINQTQVDAEIRLSDIYTSASNMRAYARTQGIEGQLVNNLTDKEVLGHLDKKRPIIFLSDLTPGDKSDVASMHYRVIDGYRWSGNELQLHIVDPWGKSYWRSWDSLLPEWQNIRAVGAESGYNRFGLVLGANPADQAFGSDRLHGVYATESLVDATADIINNATAVSHGKVWEFFAAIFNGLRAFFSALLLPFQALFRKERGPTDGKEANAPTVTAASAKPVAPQATPEFDRSELWTKPKMIQKVPEGTVAAKLHWASPDMLKEAQPTMMARDPHSRGLEEGLKLPTGGGVNSKKPGDFPV